MVLWDDTGIYDMNYCNRLNSKPLSYLFGFFYPQGRQTELYVLWFWLFKSEHTTEQTFKGSGDCEPWYTVCSGQWNFYVYMGNYYRFPQVLFGCQPKSRYYRPQLENLPEHMGSCFFILIQPSTYEEQYLEQLITHLCFVDCRDLCLACSRWTKANPKKT